MPLASRFPAALRWQPSASSENPKRAPPGLAEFDGLFGKSMGALPDGVIMRFLKRFMAALRLPCLPPAHIRRAAQGAPIEAYPMEVGVGWIYYRLEKYHGWLSHGKKANSCIQADTRADLILALENLNKLFQDKRVLILTERK